MTTSSTSIQRNDFFHSLESYASQAKSSDKIMALILVDIENFSRINLQFGYQTGELFIHKIFQKMEGLAKLENCAFRISDSVLALILPVIESENLLVLAANKILSELKVEMECNNYMIMPTPRVGMSASDAVNAEVIFKEAKEYLAAAQETGQEFVLHLDKEELDEIESFPEKFYSALTQNQFELYYQAKKNFSTEGTKHVEALLRWKIEDNLFVPPEKIINEAEKSTENNFNLTKWVVNRALRQVKVWQEENLQLCVSVNVSATLIHRSDFITMIKDALAIWGVEPESLMIEITETAFMAKKDLCHENLQTLKKMGIRLSIDDFGTGYSSLSYFKEIPASELKIDKAFILNLTQSKEDQKLVRLMIEIAHSFNLLVVAEGIESLEAYEFLKELGCDYGQGFFIAKPVNARQFTDWLAIQK